MYAGPRPTVACAVRDKLGKGRAVSNFRRWESLPKKSYIPNEFLRIVTCCDKHSSADGRVFSLVQKGVRAMYRYIADSRDSFLPWSHHKKNIYISTTASGIWRFNNIGRCRRFGTDAGTRTSSYLLTTTNEGSYKPPSLFLNQPFPPLD